MSRGLFPLFPLRRVPRNNRLGRKRDTAVLWRKSSRCVFEAGDDRVKSDRDKRVFTHAALTKDAAEVPSVMTVSSFSVYSELLSVEQIMKMFL